MFATVLRRHGTRSQHPDANDRTRPRLFSRRNRRSGQSLVEFALILPVLMVLFAGTLDLGRLAFARVTVSNAAREGAFQAADKPTSYQAGQPCDNTTNLVVCRVQLEAKDSSVTITPADVTMTCNPSTCDKSMGNTVTVSVRGHFQLLTPLMAVFFGGTQNVTFSDSSTNQIEALPTPVISPPWSTPTPTPSPSPTGTASPTASPTATPTSTPPSCQFPSAGFAITSPADLTNLHAPTTITFKDTSTSINCGISSWFWTFGDNTTSTSQTPSSHTYIVKGDYVVTLRVTNAAGANTTGGYTIHVKP
jgi:Flp pilus assembly protein TadG